MSMHARLEAPQGFDDRRSSDRLRLRLPVASPFAHDPSADAFIHDLSRSGMLLEARVTLQVGDQIAVDLPEAGDTIARVVWTTGRFFGCQFDAPLPIAAISAALLKNPIASLPQPAGGRSPVTPEAEVDLLPLSSRFAIIVGLAAAAWTAVLALAALI